MNCSPELMWPRKVKQALQLGLCCFQTWVRTHLLWPHSDFTGFDKKSDCTKHFVIFVDKTEDSMGHRKRVHTQGLATLLPTLLTTSSSTLSAFSSLLPAMPAPPAKATCAQAFLQGAVISLCWSWHWPVLAQILGASRLPKAGVITFPHKNLASL